VLELRRGDAGMMPTDILYFASVLPLRRWFARHHATRPELQLGYWKVGSGQPSVTWPESVDEALCVGWIDGVRRRLDDERYVIRFSPRKANSVWSTVNIARIDLLEAEGRMTDAGRAAFARRRESRSGVYSFEQRRIVLPAPYQQALHTDAAAWADWQRRPPSYRQAASWWVISAKQEVTRQRRLAALIAHSASGEGLPHLVKYR
jgi:uncharacterized protein YdeI (YjbR/CyaY-like superfamily)